MAQEKSSARLDPVAFGLALAIPWAIGVFLMAIAAWLSGWGVPFVDFLKTLYLGYDASMAGAVIGAIWGLADFFIFGALIAWIYNRLRR